MKKRMWPFWMSLIVIAFVFMAGGCGGGGGGVGGGDIPPGTDTPGDPGVGEGGGIITGDDVAEAESVISEVEQDIIVANGGTTGVQIQVSKYIDELEKRLIERSEVTSMDIADDNSGVLVQFVSGLQYLISFVEEDLYDSTFSVPNGQYGTISAANAELYATEGENALVSAAYLTPISIVEPTARDVSKAIETIFQASPQPKFTTPSVYTRDGASTLHVLKNLEQYDFVALTTHGILTYARHDFLEFKNKAALFLPGSLTGRDIVGDATSIKVTTLNRIRTTDEGGVVGWEFYLALDENAAGVDVDGKRIKGVHILPEFFDFHYKNKKMNNPIIYLPVCHSMEEDPLADTLIRHGARVVIGYDNTVEQSYAYNTGVTIAKELLTGAKVKDAIAQAKQGSDNTFIYKDETITARLTMKGDDNQQLLNVQKVKIIDSSTNSPISGAEVLFTRASNGAYESYISDADGYIGIKSSTSGNVELKLPYDTYTVKATADGYQEKTQGMDFYDNHENVDTIALEGGETSGYWKDEKVADTSWYDESKDSFTISTPEQLGGVAKLAEEKIMFTGKTIVQTKDINLAGKFWSPVDEFEGIFDGGGYKISNMKLNTVEITNSASKGLFDTVSKNSEVKNVNLININISGLMNLSVIGGIAGWNKGTVSKCTSSGSISGNGGPVGGIVGINYGGTVLDCTSSGSIAINGGNSSARIGGIVGSNEGTVSGCISNGSVSSYEDRDITVSIGGIVGINDGDIYDSTPPRVLNCKKLTGRVTANKLKYIDQGGIIGKDGTYDSSQMANISGNEYSKDETGQQWGIGYDSRLSPQDPPDSYNPRVNWGSDNI